MGRIFEIAGWIIAATIGLALWILLPEARTILACLLTATLVYRVFVAAVRLTALRIVGDQLMEIRAEVGAIAERLEHVDRKANALFLNSLAHRQATSFRSISGSSVPKRLHAMH
jgi:hypothetical protein